MNFNVNNNVFDNKTIKSENKNNFCYENFYSNENYENFNSLENFHIEKNNENNNEKNEKNNEKK